MEIKTIDSGLLFLLRCWHTCKETEPLQILKNIYGN